MCGVLPGVLELQELQKMIYQERYQYQRATVPVALGIMTAAGLQGGQPLVDRIMDKGLAGNLSIDVVISDREISGSLLQQNRTVKVKCCRDIVVEELG